MTDPSSPPQRRSRIGRALSILVRTAVTLAVVGAGAGVFLVLVATRPELVPEPPQSAGQSLPAFAPAVVAVQRQFGGFGTADAMDRADVPARVASTVVEIPAGVLAGASVRRGDVLVLLDDSDFRTQLEGAASAISELDAQIARLEVEEAAWGDRVRIAEEELAIAAADVERVRAARDEGAAKDREIDQARQRAFAVERLLVAAREEFEKLPIRAVGLTALRDAQRSTKRLAEQALQRCRIESPIDGTIQVVAVKAGESVQPGQMVARVVNTDRIEVPLRLPASARRHVAVGDEVILFDGRAAERRWRATVARVAPEDDTSTRTVAVFAELLQGEGAALDPANAGAPAPRLAPGRFVEGIVIAGTQLDRMILPRRSVRGDRINVIVDGRIERREVETEFVVEGTFPELGLDDTEWVALARPLPPGEFVVLDGSRSVAPGTQAIPALPDERARSERALEARGGSGGHTASGEERGAVRTAAPGGGALP
ncbi:MAG TPA: HlyD family efflux transporter periplasmic adaptor subunit [Phycisphaerales bacterium]|nr:HlyD family efflux transporter periplasmic adaptor subunit [Phycisphaerales bacterium]HMP37886.1 HlyD family efflux transporter periplasmic adaptor subunit [Phycisphaerales bacterium]